jgi:FkbM family methyltransferase
VALARVRQLRLLPALAYYAAWLVPWRSCIKVRAEKSRLAFYSGRSCIITRYIGKYGRFEPDLTDWLAGYLASCPPGLFVDIGANVGWHSLHAARLPGVETVVAFEADPANAWLLDRNRTENDVANIVLVAAAVGDRRGTARLNRYKTSNNGRHSLAVDHGYGSITVPLIDLDGTLDDLGLGDRPIAAMKIDVEGFEPAVIAGAQRALGRTQAVVLELSPRLYRDAGLDIKTMLGVLRANGFSPFTIEAGGALQADSTVWSDQDCVCELVWLRGTRDGKARPDNG